MLGVREDAAKGRGRRGKRTKKPNCTTGRSCGMSCVDRTKACEPDLSPILKAAADAVGKPQKSSKRVSLAPKAAAKPLGTVQAIPIDINKAQAAFKRAKTAYDKVDAQYKAALAADPNADPREVRSKFQDRLSKAFRKMTEADDILAAARTIKVGRDFVGKDLIATLDGTANVKSPKILALKKELEIKDAAYQKVFDTSDDPFSTPEWKAYIKVSNELRNAEADGGATRSPMNAIRDKLLSRSSADAAKESVNQVKIAKSASKRHDEESLRSALVELYQISGGRSNVLRDIKATESRAWADDISNSVNIGWGESSANTTRDLYHEVGHLLEAQSLETVQAAWGFRIARAEGDAKPMGGQYDDDEIAYPGKYIDPYVGKVYKENGGPTEVLSMGIQHFSTPEDMMSLYEQDPEHFFLTIGALLND